MPSYQPKDRLGVLRTMLAQRKAGRPVVKPPPSSPDVIPPPTGTRPPGGRSVDPGFYRGRGVGGDAGPQRSSAGNLSDYKDVKQGGDQQLNKILTFNETHAGGEEIGRFNATHTKGKGNRDLLEILREMKRKRAQAGSQPQGRATGRTTYTPPSGTIR